MESLIIFIVQITFCLLEAFQLIHETYEILFIRERNDLGDGVAFPPAPSALFTGLLLKVLLLKWRLMWAVKKNPVYSFSLQLLEAVWTWLSWLARV